MKDRTDSKMSPALECEVKELIGYRSSEFTRGNCIKRQEWLAIQRLGLIDVVAILDIEINDCCDDFEEKGAAQ